MGIHKIYDRKLKKEILYRQCGLIKEGRISQIERLIDDKEYTRRYTKQQAAIYGAKNIKYSNVNKKAYKVENVSKNEGSQKFDIPSESSDSVGSIDSEDSMNSGSSDSENERKINKINKFGKKGYKKSKKKNR